MRLKKMLRLRSLPVTAWQPLLLYAVFVAGLGALLWFSLGLNTTGYSASEVQALQASSSWHTIFTHPLNAPFTIITRLLLYAGHNGLLATRLSASLLGAATLTVFYLLVRHWHGERTAVFGTLLFGASAWFLHVARLGSPSVLLFSLLLLIAAMIWHKHTNSSLSLLTCFVLGALLLYVPGMIWFIVLGALWKWRTVDRMFKKHLWVVSGGALLFALALAPLGLAIYHDTSLAKVIAGLPAQGWPMPDAVMHHLLNVPLSLLLRSPLDPEHWLSHLAILDYFGMAMLALGAYVYAKHLKLDRTRLLVIALVLGTLLVGLGGAVTISIIMPFVYILIAAGVGFMLERWYVVFPRNTIAQGVGLALISLAVVASVGYSARHYFVAWPEAGATRQIFTVQPATVSVKIGR